MKQKKKGKKKTKCFPLLLLSNYALMNTSFVGFYSDIKLPRSCANVH